MASDDMQFQNCIARAPRLNNRPHSSSSLPTAYGPLQGAKGGHEKSLEEVLPFGSA